MIKRSICSFAIILVLSGCIGGMSPEPDYFTLAPVSGSALSDVTDIVRIQRPTLPGYLDRPDFIRQDSDYGIQIDESRRWAEPLDTMFERVLLQDLQQRLPAARLMSEDSGISTAPRVTVTLDLQQFNEVPHGQVAMEAELDIKSERLHEQLPLQHISYAVNTDSSTTAENLSVLVGKLADGIATLLHNQVVQSEKATLKSVKPAVTE